MANVTWLTFATPACCDSVTADSTAAAVIRFLVVVVTKLSEDLCVVTLNMPTSVSAKVDLVKVSQ